VAGSFVGALGTTLFFYGVTYASPNISGDNVILSGPGTIGSYSANSTTINGSQLLVTFAGSVGSLGTLSVTNNATAIFTGGVSSVGGITISNGAATFSPSNPGTLTLPSLSLSGTLSSSDSITVTGAFAWTGGTLSGTGSVTAQGGLTIDTTNSGLVLDGCTLINTGSASLKGRTYAYLAPHNGATLINQSSATFDIQGSASEGTPSIYDNGSTSGTFTNYGTVTVEQVGNAGAIYLPFNNAGSFVLNSGSFALGDSVHGVLSTSSGSFTGAKGTYLDFVGPQTFSATSSLSGDQVNFGDYFGAQAVVNFAGHYAVSGTTSSTFGNLTFSGGRDSAGNLLDSSIGTLQLYNASATFQGDIGIVDNLNVSYDLGYIPSGTVTLNGGVQSILGNVDVEEGGILNFLGSIGSGGASTIGNLTVNSVNFGSSYGTVNFSPAGGPATLTLGSLTVSGGVLTGTDSFLVSGQFTWAGGTLQGPQGSSLTAQGSLTMDEPASDSLSMVLDGRTLNNAGTAYWLEGNIGFKNGSVFNNQAGATFNDVWQGGGRSFTPLDATATTFNNAGTFIKSDSNAEIMNVPFTNTGTVTMQSGTLSIGNYTQTAGSTILAGGTLQGTILIHGGNLSGTGTINGSVSNAGSASLGGGTGGLLTIEGDYTQAAGTTSLLGGSVTCGNFVWTGGALSGTGSVTASNLLVTSTTASDTITAQGGTAPGSVQLNSMSLSMSNTLTLTVLNQVSITGTGGSDTYTIIFGSMLTTPIAVTGSGNDTLTVNGSTDPNTTNYITKNGTSQTVTWGSTAAQVIETVPYSGIQSITVNGGQGSNYITDPGSRTTINGGPRQNTITITATSGTGVVLNGGPSSSTNNYVVDMGNLLGPVTINSTTGTSTVTVNAPPGSNVLTLSSTQLTGAGETINFNVGSTATNLTVAGGSGSSDQLVVQGTPPAPLTAKNLAPTVGAITGPAAPALISMALSVSAGFTNLDGNSQTAVWNWGDGSSSADTVNQTGTTGSVTGSHVYAAVGVYMITLTVTDSTGGGASTAIFTFDVLKRGVTQFGGQVFIVGGNTTNDVVQISPIGSSTTGSTGVQVKGNINSVATATTINQAVTALVIYGFSGNDTIQLANSLTVNATISAGNGNDTVQAGSGNINVTLGNGNDTVQLGNGNNTVTLGNGNDTVLLGNGNNVVVIGNGTDTIQAGNGDNLIAAGLGQHTVLVGNGSNILIDGTVTLTQNGDSLRQVLSDWISYGKAASNVASIRKRLHVTYNTSHANTLLAGSGLDWFWETYAKDTTNRKPSDLLN
jgi:hypothetical protein